MSGHIDHVVAVMAGIDPIEPRAHTRCEHCGERLVIALPVRVEVWLAANHSFLAAHARCPKLQRTCNQNDEAPSIDAEGAINREIHDVK